MLLLDYDEETNKGLGEPTPFHWRDLYASHAMPNLPCDAHPKIVKFYLYAIEALHHGVNPRMPKDPLKHCPQCLKTPLTWAMIASGRTYRSKLNAEQWAWLLADPPRFERRLTKGYKVKWLRDG